MKKERIILWTITVLILGGTVFALAKLPKSEKRPLEGRIVDLPAVTEADWITGNKSSTNTLVEYGDFQCPACGSYHSLIKKLLTEHGKDFRFVFRHFPLQQHANAKNAAYAAEAAGRQRKFWEMHDMIYEHQSDWSEKTNAQDIFLGYANALKLNADQFKKDRGLAEVEDRVNKNLQEGLKIRINATPTFFLNGKQIQPQTYDQFVNFIKPAGSVSPSPIPSASSRQAQPTF